MFKRRKVRRRSRLTREEQGSWFSPAVIREIFSWILCAAAAIVAAVLLVIAFGKSVDVTSDAMSPTMEHGQKALINRLKYQMSTPAKGDMILFFASGNQARTYIRRVYGVPGDRILIERGRICINGEYIEEDYEPMEDAGIAAEEILLDTGEYFVLGDNRNHCEDSRSINIGIVKKDTILGKIWRVYGEKN